MPGVGLGYHLRQTIGLREVGLGIAGGFLVLLIRTLGVPAVGET